MHGGGIPPGGVATGDENLRPYGKGCQWLLGRIFENAWDDEIAGDFRGRSLIKRISREATRKTRIQFRFRVHSREFAANFISLSSAIRRRYRALPHRHCHRGYGRNELRRKHQRGAGTAPDERGRMREAPRSGGPGLPPPHSERPREGWANGPCPGVRSGFPGP